MIKGFGNETSKLRYHVWEKRRFNHAAGKIAGFIACQSLPFQA